MAFRRPIPYAPSEGQCMVPDVLRGVKMSHSGDTVEVWHGLDTPAVACGFHATYYAPEVFAAHMELAGVSRSRSTGEDASH